MGKENRQVKQHYYVTSSQKLYDDTSKTMPCNHSYYQFLSQISYCVIMLTAPVHIWKVISVDCNLLYCITGLSADKGSIVIS